MRGGEARTRVRTENLGSRVMPRRLPAHGLARALVRRVSHQAMRAVRSRGEVTSSPRRLARIWSSSQPGGSACSMARLLVSSSPVARVCRPRAIDVRPRSVMRGRATVASCPGPVAGQLGPRDLPQVVVTHRRQHLLWRARRSRGHGARVRPSRRRTARLRCLTSGVTDFRLC